VIHYEKGSNMKRQEIIDTISAREAIMVLVEDLKKYAQWEYENQPKVPGTDTYFRHRRDAIKFAAEYIEKAL
jgi:hypothetical protein